MEIDKIPQWILALEPEDATFLKNFVLKSGSLKEIARLYEVSYPTVRLRLDKLIQKIELSDQKEEEPFSTFIKGLAVDSRIDLETAKIIIENINRKRRKNHETLDYSDYCDCIVFLARAVKRNKILVFRWPTSFSGHWCGNISTHYS